MGTIVWIIIGIFVVIIALVGIFIIYPLCKLTKYHDDAMLDTYNDII